MACSVFDKIHPVPRAWDAIWCWDTKKAHPLVEHYASIFRKLWWHVSFVVSFSTGTRYKPLVCSQCLSAPSCQAGKLQGFSHINICEVLLWCKGHLSACLLEGQPTAFKWVLQSLCTNSIAGVSQVWKSVLEKIFRKEKSVITNSEGCYCTVLGVWWGFFVYF